MAEEENSKKVETEEIKDTDIKEGMFFAGVGYISVLCLVPLFLKKDNKFAMHHGKQGLVLFIAEVAISIVGGIPIIGWVIALIGWVFFGILSLIGIIQVLMGKYWKMPVVYNIAKKMTLP